MDRSPLDTQDRVFAAADRLFAEGREVNATTLLEVLGGGSLATIYKHLDAWEAKRNSAICAMTMPESVSTALNQVWQASVREMGKEVRAIRERADTEIKAVTRRFDEALSHITRLENEASSRAAQIESLTAQLAERESALDAVTTEKSALAAMVEQMWQQIETQQAELERLHREMETERAERQREVERLTGDSERERQARLDAEADAVQRLQEANTAREDAARWQGQAEAFQTQYAELMRRLAPVEADKLSDRPTSIRVEF